MSTQQCAAGTIAALGQALIPFFTGRIIDYASIDPNRHEFMMTTFKLVGVSLACALATGVRGGLFTVAMTRLNVRIRTQLFASLLRQEIGFYDTSKTGNRVEPFHPGDISGMHDLMKVKGLAGDITSRLSADTTTVSDQICLNINVVVRSLTQAVMVFVFMLGASWRLTVITTISLPATIIICRIYGEYFRQALPCHHHWHAVEECAISGYVLQEVGQEGAD